MSRVELHHIQHWSVYQIHDASQMVAVCPTCHDAAHRQGGISEETLLRWKNIPRDNELIRDHLYVEPFESVIVLLGSMCVRSDGLGAAVFRLSNGNTVSFKLIDNEILLLDGLVKDVDGNIIIKIVENYVSFKKSKNTFFHQRPGKFSVYTSEPKKFLPSWTFKIMQRAISELIIDGRLTIIDLEVVRPGVVRLEGAFVAEDAVFAVTGDKVLCLRQEFDGPVAFVGSGEGSIIEVSGPLTMAAFQM